MTASTPTASPPRGVIASRLRLSVMRLSRRLRQAAEPQITPSQLSALSTVDQSGPMTVGTLSQVEHVRPPTMTGIVAALVEQGLVTREGDPLDRRVAWVMVTSSGRTLLKRTRRRGDEYLAKQLRSLEPSELETLERATLILERLAEGER